MLNIVSFLTVLVVVASASNSDNDSDRLYTFLSIGDWGGAAVSASISDNVYAVADQMRKTAKATNAKFVVSTGDNFYWCGVQNTSDFQFKVDYEDPYKGIDLPWYQALGNHEYGYNVSAQILYSDINKNWILPDRYYTKRIQLDTDMYMTMITIDTSPCISAYRSSDNTGYDPCSPTYPTCSFGATDDDFEGPCEFNQNILSQNCGEQYEWLKKELENVPTGDWLIINAHHPVDEIDVLDFTTLIQSHGFDLYMNGHTHTLNQYTIDYGGAYMTTGAGSLVDTADQTQEITAKKANGIKNLLSKSEESHSYQTVWNLKVAGFTSHTFNSEFTELKTDFISYTGEVVHTFTITK